MELARNPFKAALSEGRHQLGLWSSLSDGLSAEMLAGTGYDWILFDGEHGPLDALSVVPLLQAVAPYPVHPIVRVVSLDPAEIKRLLDFGAQSILVPYIETAEQAALAAASVAYPPDGIRGFAGVTRASGFGRRKGYAAAAREDICLLVQIETKTGLDNLDAIAATPGIDGIFIGPADLAASLGHLGQPGHPEVRAAAAEAIRRIRAAGKAAGFMSLDDELSGEMIAAGSLFTAIDVDIAILKTGAEARRKAWRERLGS